MALFFGLFSFSLQSELFILPKVKLPTTLKGWVISAVASMVGFFAGLAAISFLTKWWK